jgi:hypothetical protein
MSDVISATPATPDAPPLPGLLSRAIGIITSPGATFVHVVRTPKVAGMLFLTSLLIGLAQGVPQFTERGRAAALEMQVQQMENWGATVSDEMYQQLEQRSRTNTAAYLSIFGVFVAMPFGAVLITALFWAVFNTVMGGTATFKQVMSVVVHSQMISALGAIVAAPIMYARGVMSTSIANLGALLPMLEENSFLAKVLGMLDLFFIWWLVVLAIGMATLYKRKTSSVATGLFVFFGICVLVIAYFTAG